MTTSKPVLLTLATLSLLGALYLYRSARAPFAMSSTSTPEQRPTTATTTSILGLTISLSQISRSPPSLIVTLRNTSPDTPYTLLKWDTPLDPLAPKLGVFRLRDAETGADVPIDRIMVNRMTPPRAEDYVTVGPGSEEAHEVVFEGPWMPDVKPAKYRVWAEGTWRGVWDKWGDEVKKEEYFKSPFGGRGFGSGEVEMRVE